MAVSPATEFEFEEEFEDELSQEFEDELEGEDYLGSVTREVGGALGLGEGEWEDELELDGEFEFEAYPESEEFFRRVGRFVRRHAGTFRNIARIAAPIVGTAVGGPLGGMIGRVASQALREDEFEYEAEAEYGPSAEAETEEEASAPLSSRDALAELMASVASQAQTEAEAEAMAGAAAIASLSAADAAALRRVLPHMVRGMGVLTRVLRRQPSTRPAVRAIPSIMRRTARTLRRRSAAGQPVTRRTAARAMATQTRRVLGSPRACTVALQRNVRASRRATASRPMQRMRSIAG
jgi:hypothetical protein